MDMDKARQLASILGGPARKARPSCILSGSGKPAVAWVVELLVARGEAVSLDLPASPMNEQDARAFAAALGGEAHKFEGSEWVFSLDLKDGKVAEFQPPYVYIYMSREDYENFGEPLQIPLL